jgi:hypothetical protein
MTRIHGAETSGQPSMVPKDSEAVKKSGESVEREYLRSSRIAVFERQRQQGSISER